MTYEEIWQKLKGMSRQERKLLAHEVSLHLKQSAGSLTEDEDRHEGADAVGYIHPHYYFDAKAIHEILFYPPNSQHEVNDKEGKYYKALKETINGFDNGKIAK